MPKSGKDIGIKSRNVIWTQISGEENTTVLVFLS